MTLLIVGIVVFLGVHLLPTFPEVRERLIGALGENGYKALFSILSILGFVLIALKRRPAINVVGGLLLYVAFLVWLHPLLIGTSPLP